MTSRRRRANRWRPPWRPMPAHFRHAAHERLWQRLRQRFPALRVLFHPPRDGGCHPAWAAPRDANLVCRSGAISTSSADVGFRCPRIGRAMVSAPGCCCCRSDATRKRMARMRAACRSVAESTVGAASGGAGWGEGLAWPLRRLPSLLGMAVRLGWHAAWVAEEGYRRRAGKHRVLRRLVVATGSGFAAAAAPTLVLCRSGGSREQRIKFCRSGGSREADFIRAFRRSYNNTVFTTTPRPNADNPPPASPARPGGDWRPGNGRWRRGRPRGARRGRGNRVATARGRPCHGGG